MNRDQVKLKAKELAAKAEARVEQGLVSVEAKFPVGTAVVCFVVGVVLGLYLRGLVR
jgi:hypothetical protein